MDAFFSGLDSRLRVSVKAVDSIMVGLVNAAMEDAYRKSLWKDGDLDRLFHKLRFAELAIMQLEWCLRFVCGEMEDDDGQEQLLDDLLETRDQIQARLDEAELAVAEADRDYMRRKRAELAPARGRETPPAAGRQGAEEECGRAFGELRVSVIRKMSRMRARLEDASSTLAALMEKVSGEASPMARLQEAGHEGEGVKGLSGFYGMAQLLMEFQEMVLDAGVVRDSVASSFDAMERSVSALGAAMDEQQWLMDAEREMYSAVVEGFVREINVGSDRTSSPGEGSRPPTLHHDSDATENSLEEFQSSEDETRKSDSRQCYQLGEHCIHREEAERLTGVKIDSDVGSDLQCVLYTAVFRDLVRKLAVQAYDLQKLKEEKDEMDIASKLQCEIYGSIFKDSLKKLDELAVDSADHFIKTLIKDEVHAVFLAKTLNAWKSATEMVHSERHIKEEMMQNNVTTEDEGPDSDQHGVPVKQEILSFGANHDRRNSKGGDQQAEMSTVRDDVSYSVKNNVKDGLEYQRKAQTGEIDIGFSMTPESTIKEMLIRSTKFQAMSMDFEAVTCGKLETAVLRLRDLDKQLANLVEQVSSLKKSELIYRTAFTRRCCDLQTAEAEVDLLGDEVDLLLGLLSKTYKVLDHYSPVLQHYHWIRETLSMLGKELALRHQIR
ncbi:WPP domain-associated protein-like [Panicum virgatum]|uniref:WPP domain-associated protein-like n=1 Tax=Panicum virgatum TaxID=38727 RepID=UPI0019D582AF|nr:WPP domain-associated protein-like [Panicum virgatum]